jgi:hypothetical protein
MQLLHHVQSPSAKQLLKRLQSGLGALVGLPAEALQRQLCYVHYEAVLAWVDMGMCDEATAAIDDMPCLARLAGLNL